VEDLAAQSGDAAQAALKAGLVDKLATDEELQQELGKLVGIDPDTGAYWQIDDRDYLRATNAERATARSSKIGLIVISGPIVEGESWSGVAGADTIADLIRSGYKNKDIAALVLRINSPGGSLYASEKIRRQVLAAREAGKPIVVSMSSMATSGGYWVAVNANQIWAEDSTITGSIGIFSLQLSVNQLMERLGVNTDSVETTPWAGAMRFDRPLSPDAKRVIQLQVNHGYDRFVTLVSEGRGLSVEAVKQIAQGRVWTGRDAIRIGLVDQVGGLDAATKSAARLAGIAEGQSALVPIRPPHKLLKQLLDRAVKVSEQSAVEEMLPASLHQRIHPFGANLSLGWMNDEKGIYAFCPCQPDLGAGTE
jgi:protease-4